MEALNANDYMNKLIQILFRELKSHDENMEKNWILIKISNLDSSKNTT
jgi:hypothetical protein